MRSRHSGPTVVVLLAFLLPSVSLAAGLVDDELLAIPDGKRAVLVFTWEGVVGADETLAYLPFERRYPGDSDVSALVSGAYRGLRLDVVVSRPGTLGLLKAVEAAGLKLRICSGFGSCARAVQGECKAIGTRATTFDLSRLEHACEGACEDGTKIVHACVQRTEAEE